MASEIPSRNKALSCMVWCISAGPVPGSYRAWETRCSDRARQAAVESNAGLVMVARCADVVGHTQLETPGQKEISCASGGCS